MQPGARRTIDACRVFLAVSFELTFEAVECGDPPGLRAGVEEVYAHLRPNRSTDLAQGVDSQGLSLPVVHAAFSLSRRISG